MSNEPTFTFPPPIVDMVVKGLWAMSEDAPYYSLGYDEHGAVVRVTMGTDAGPITILRGPEMERT